MGMTTPGPDQNKAVQCQSRHDAGGTMQTSLCSAKSSTGQIEPPECENSCQAVI